MRNVSVAWVVVFAGIWWVLAGSLGEGWIAGGIAVLAGAFFHTALGGRRGGGIRPWAFVRFVPYFLLLSVRGGIDVARRALAPSLRLRPDLLRYPIALPEGPARVFFVNAISLLPGTFSAELRDRALTVHVLAPEADVGERLGELEARVSDLFGILPGDGKAGA